LVCHRPNSCFNTQPPEGGWHWPSTFNNRHIKFQHTAARRRLGQPRLPGPHYLLVSTHSRPKAAG